MANTTIQLKRTSSSGNIPNKEMLSNGEFILNFADGKLFFKNTSNIVVSIGPGGGTVGNNFGTVEANGTNLVAGAGGQILTIKSANGISIVGDAATDSLYINLTATGVVSNVYGGTYVPIVLNIDSYGRVVSAANVSNSVIYKMLSANTLVANTAGAVIPWFSVNGNTTLQSHTTYLMRGQLIVERGLSVTTINIGFNGTCTYNTFSYSYIINPGKANGVQGTTQHSGYNLSNTIVSCTSGGLGINGFSLLVDGIIATNVGGTFTPVFSANNAAGAPIYFTRGTFIWLSRITDDESVSKEGIWGT